MTNPTLSAPDLPRNIRTKTLEEAKDLINGPRQDHYGSPAENFAAVAKMWSAYLGQDITARDVCMMMVFLKAVRFKTSPENADHAIDICGYAAIASELSIGGCDGIPEKMEE